MVAQPLWLICLCWIYMKEAYLV